MPKRRLLWQLFPPYLLITLVAVFGVGWLTVRWFEAFYVDAVRDELVATARSLVAHVPDELDAPGEHPSDLCQDLARTSASRVAVLLPSGRVICDSEKGPGDMSDQLNRPEIRQALAGEVGSETRYNPAVEQRVIYAAVPVLREGSVRAVVYTSKALGPLDRAVRTAAVRIALTGAALGLVGAALSSLVSRRTSVPLIEMRRAAERFARGELDYKLVVPDSDELAGLAGALNQMAKQLRERIGTIERQNNEQRAVLSSMIEGVLAVDNQERVISVNKALGQLLGLDQSHVQGRRLQEIVRNTDLRRFVARVLASKEPLEADLLLHGDPEGVLQARGAPLHDARGYGIGAVIVLHDVTSFRQLEHMRRDFVANVSHELKTPVTAIKGFVETLLDGAINQQEDAERFLHIVVKQADRLNAIIEDLLSLSKIEESEEANDILLERSDVGEVLESAAHNCQTIAADRNICVKLDYQTGLVARVNAPLLEQALTNLLDNAIKYSELGSSVEVRATQADHEVTIAVVDHGCGIAAEHLHRIFERFYRVDKARSRKLGGTGLGLAIVKHIVQAHHGRVDVKSTPGIGSTFAIQLPMA